MIGAIPASMGSWLREEDGWDRRVHPFEPIQDWQDLFPRGKISAWQESPTALKRKVSRVSRSKLEELTVFPLRPNSASDDSLRPSPRLLDELSGVNLKTGNGGIPEFSPELREKVLELVAGTCRKSMVT